MDARPHERARQGRHGLVSVALAALAVAAASLFAAVAGGLLRACPATAPPGLPGWLVAGATSHAALMICGFLGTLVATERAVAVGRAWAWLPPAASALGALLLIGGDAGHGRLALLLAGLAFVGVSVAIVRRQFAPHTILLAIGAGAWLVGNAMLLADAGTPLPWWFAFLVLTVAAERLEMTRLTRRARTTGLQLAAVVAVLLAGATAASLAGAVAALGIALFGAGLLLLAAWLFAHDIATRTIRAAGLGRYMATCLLLGYGWLAVAGVGWIGLAAGRPWRDMALHALGLGFIVSMMMAHAPVILPALTRVRVRFGAAFYAPVALLHVSLAIRLGLGLDDPLRRGMGAALNAAALLLFIATMAGAAVAWRLARGGPTRRELD